MTYYPDESGEELTEFQIEVYRKYKVDGAELQKEGTSSRILVFFDKG